jgi:adenylyl-sulfate kinase
MAPTARPVGVVHRPEMTLFRRNAPIPSHRHVSRAARAREGQVIWLTGLPGAGKSTIAERIVEELRGQGRDPLLLDGDVIRASVSRDLGYSSTDRNRNVERVASLAREHCRQGGIAVVAMISPLRQQRDDARRRIGGVFTEVFVKASLEECIRRDPKGLYKRALAGEILDFTGISSPYEVPPAPDLVVDTERQTLRQATEDVLAALALA